MDDILPYTPETAIPGQQVLGTNNGERLDGTSASDFIVAGGGDDNPVNGGNGNDVFLVGAGFDKMYGQSGFDTALFPGLISDYRGLDFSGNTVHVVESLSSAPVDTGRDRLKGFELFEFADAFMNPLTGEVTSKGSVEPPPPPPDPDPSPDPEPEPDPDPDPSPDPSPPPAPGDILPYTPETAIPDKEVTGTSNGEELSGTGAAEFFDAGAGDDIPVKGGGGNDVFLVGAGFDKMYGDGGFDTALFPGSINDYDGLDFSGNTVHVVDSRDSAPVDTGRDRLVKFELFEFADAFMNPLTGEVTSKGSVEPPPPPPDPDPSPDPDPAPPNPNVDLDVMLIGDSFSIPGRGLPGKLENALEQRGYGDVEIVDLTQSGRTSYGARNAVFDYFDNPNADIPEVAVLAIGINDALRNRNPDQLEKVLGRIIDELDDNGVQEVVLAAPESFFPLKDTKPPGEVEPQGFSDPADQAAFRQVYIDLADAKDVILADDFIEGLTDDPSLLENDVFHPNPQGVDVILDNILPEVVLAVENVIADDPNIV